MRITGLVNFVLIAVLLASMAGCGGGNGTNATVPDGSGNNENPDSNNSKVLLGGAIQGADIPLSATAQVTTVNGSFYKDPSYLSVDTPFSTDGITSDEAYLYVAHASGRIVKIQIATGIITLLAGGSQYGTADGIGADAQFYNPTGIVVSGPNLYVADSSNNTIRKIVISTGEVSTFAGKAGIKGDTDGIGAAATFDSPRGITTDGANLYVADCLNDTIRQINIATGAVTTLAGTAGASGSTDGVGAAARFNAPVDIATDGSNLYVVDWDNKNSIRKIVIATKEVSTLVKGADPAYVYNGIATDGANLYAADSNNNCVLKIDTVTGSVSTLAGVAGTSGLVDGGAAVARFDRPRGITAVGSTLVIIDANNQKLREIDIPTGSVVTKQLNSKSTDGPAAIATFNRPADITTDGTNLYVADAGNNTIRKMVISTGTVSTLAGKAGYAGSVDAVGSQARFNDPTGITTDGKNLYVADWGNNTIRIVDISTGNTKTLAGTAGVTGSADGTGPTARFNNPNHLTTDGTYLYVTDSGNNTIRRIVISSGSVSTLAGTAGMTGTTDGTGPAARFNYPSGITTDGTDLYVTDTDNDSIRKISISTGLVTTLAGLPSFGGSANGIGTAASFFAPDSVTTDGANLYVSDTGNQTIRKIVLSTGVVSTIAGYVDAPGNEDGLGTTARFFYPWGITTDGTSIYVVDHYNDRIRKLD